LKNKNELELLTIETCSSFRIGSLESEFKAFTQIDRIQEVSNVITPKFDELTAMINRANSEISET
jgi:hypothetical protein